MVSSTTSSGNSSNVNTLCPRSRPMSGVRVTTRLTMRIRSHGSSRRKRTQTSNTAPPTSSMHSKPASSRMPATGSIWAVVMRVAHRHWCASRNVVSITFTLLTQRSRRLPVLRGTERVYAAGGDAELGGDVIDAGQHLRHGVLDLDACIHLDEVEATAGRLEDELDGAGVAIPDLAHEREGGVAHARAKGRRHRGRGSFLE